MRTIGTSSVQVPSISLGCMSLGTDRNEAKKIISFALDEGIIHLDTADLYDFGQNEKIIGELVKHHRDQIVLTTKVGNHFNAQTESWYWDPSQAYMAEAIKHSLNRLQTDYIDLYLLHGGTIADPIDETIAGFEQLKQSGMIRAYGISSIRPNVIKEYMERSNMDAVMMQYSLLDRRPEEWLDILHEHNISVLARGSLAKGLLSNKADKYRKQKASEGYVAYDEQELRLILDKLKEFALPLQQLAFQYVLKHPAVASVVVGASSQEQLRENSPYLHMKPMDDTLYHAIQQITKSTTYTQHR